MSDDCACLYGGYDGCDENDLHAQQVVKARKSYVCRECRQTIPKGARYVRYAGTNDDHRIFVVKTCLLCEEIRKALYCDGYYFGQLWEDIEEQLFENNLMNSACLAKLDTPEAKQFLQQRWWAWVEARSK